MVSELGDPGRVTGGDLARELSLPFVPFDATLKEEGRDRRRPERWTCLRESTDPLESITDVLS